MFDGCMAIVKSYKEFLEILKAPAEQRLSQDTFEKFAARTGDQFAKLAQEMAEDCGEDFAQFVSLKDFMQKRLKDGKRK